MRRFIAGAVCPACRAEDRTVLELLVDTRRRLCVACGHEELEDLQSARSVPEPPSRFNRAVSEGPAVPIRLFVPERSSLAPEPKKER